MDKELRDLFTPFGTLKDVKIKTKAGSNNSYCFIEYENVDDAAKAQEEYLSKYNRLRGKDFKGKELKVEFGRGERKAEDRRSYYLCYLGTNVIFATRRAILPRIANTIDTMTILDTQVKMR